MPRKVSRKKSVSRRKASPKRKKSPSRRKASPKRKKSPSRRKASPKRKKSPSRRKASPKRKSPVSPQRASSVRASPVSPQRASPVSPVNITPPQSFVPFYNFVSGLAHFNVLYSQTYNKLIILMGEAHTRDPVLLCNPVVVTADLFLSQMLKTTTRTIDVFLENHYSVINPKNNRYFINMSESSGGFMNKFNADNKKNNCIRSVHNQILNCKEYGNNHVRFHSGDIRDARVSGILDYLNIIYDAIMNPGAGPDIARKIMMYNVYEDSNRIKTDLRGLVVNSKIKKQIDNTQIPIIQDMLTENIKGLINPTAQCLEVLKPSNALRIITSPVLLPSVSDPDFDNKMVVFRQNMANRDILMYNCDNLMLLDLMDTYLLGRVFRSFSGVAAKNIIIYAGAKHTETYEKFLERIGFTSLYKGTNTARLCMNITGLEINWI